MTAAQWAASSVDLLADLMAAWLVDLSAHSLVVQLAEKMADL
jgi:hypothetical protein